MCCRTAFLMYGSLAVQRGHQLAADQHGQFGVLRPQHQQRPHFGGVGGYFVGGQEHQRVDDELALPRVQRAGLFQRWPLYPSPSPRA